MSLTDTTNDLLITATVLTKHAVKAEAQGVKDAKRDVVMAAMYHKGSLYDLLTDEEHKHVFLAGNGFGDFYTYEDFTANTGGYDWSHIRDSNKTGVERMFSRIVEIVATRIAEKSKVYRKETL